MNQDFTYGRNFADFLGSFWSTIFDKGALGAAVGYASSESLVQSYMDMVDVINSLSIYTIPEFSRQNVYPVIMRKSRFESYQEHPEYGSGAYFGVQPDGGRYLNGGSVRYGVAAKLGTSYFYPVTQGDVASFGVFALNRLFEPSVTLCNGADFFQVDGGIVFAGSPFDNPLFPSRKVWDEASQSMDEEVVVWFCDIDRDTLNLYKQFGYTFTNFKRSSEQYKKVIQTVYEIVSRGPSIFRIDAFVSSVAGSPLIREAQETVESVSETPEGTIVATDLNVYQISSGAGLRPYVVPGATLAGGTPLLDIVEIVDTKQDGWWKGFEAIPVRKDTFRGVGGFLSFPNREDRVAYLPKSPLYNPVYRGVTFGLIGSEEAAKRLWDAASENAVSLEEPYGFELFQKYGPPGGTELDFVNGATFSVNPARVLAEDIFPGCMLPIKLKTGLVSDLEFFFGVIDVLRPSCPVHINLMLFIEMTGNMDEAALSSGQVSVEPVPLESMMSAPAEAPETDAPEYGAVERVSVGGGFYGGSYNFLPEDVGDHGALTEKIDLSSGSVVVQNIELKQIPKCIA